MIRSEDENEVVRLVRDHAENTHGISVSRDDVQNGMEEAAAD
jgi:predicted small metal-binding protein